MTLDRLTSFYSPASWGMHISLLAFVGFLSRAHENLETEEKGKGKRGRKGKK